MRIGDSNDDDFIDRTGQRGGGMSGFGGGGGGMLGMLLPFVFSKFGFVGVAILLLGMCAFGGLGGGGSLLGGSAPTSQSSAAGVSTLTAEQRTMLRGTLTNTDAVWGELFQAAGQRYTEPRLVAFTEGTQTACGQGQAAFGPFYCPGDQNIYIDPAFFSEMERKFGAKGDMGARYVIAHEVGHHVQKLEGTLDKASAAQARMSKTEGNAVQVGVELQADCYAGVWAARAKASDGTRAIEPGDLEEGLQVARAIGDDALMGQAGQSVNEKNFTHGSSAQRMEALQRGLSSGDPRVCTYNRA